MEEYNKFDWKTNEKWLQYFVNIDIVSAPGVDTELALERVKRRWYKKHVDPNIEFPVEAVPDPPEESAANRSSSTNTSSSTSSNTNSNRNSSTTNNASYNASQNTTYNANQNTLKNILYYPWLVANVFLLLNSLVLIYFGDLSYRYILYCTITTCLINLLTIYGLPQLNKEYWIRIITNDSTYYILLSLVLMSNPMILLVVPILTIYALFNLTSNLVEVLPRRFPSNHPINVKFTSKLFLLNALSMPAYYGAAWLEVSLFPFLFVTVLLGQNSILLFFMYWQFISQRY
eukprot:TRINITY_DN19380_c0_g1_i1.p1 TRINITY_DN19380_c0_g1~~TRINITY_DN19380_c0_g1_i1.p1  ORF type:complete len:301 (-),score=64.79 TRINITY_DN19380_c0_g1_i1:22-885(-)